MNNRFVDLDRLIDCLIDFKHEDKRTTGNELKSSYSNNGQLSVKIGLERKYFLEQIALEKKLDISKVTRFILDEYFREYFGNGANIKSGYATAWKNQKETTKV